MAGSLGLGSFGSPGFVLEAAPDPLRVLAYTNAPIAKTMTNNTGQMVFFCLADINTCSCLMRFEVDEKEVEQR
jgi:hypothetical protein